MSDTNVSPAPTATQAGAGLGIGALLAHAVPGGSGLSTFKEDPIDHDTHLYTDLHDRLDSCQCFMVADGDLGLLHEFLADAVKSALVVGRSDVARELLAILEREVQTFVFHDYLNGEYREEIDRRMEVLRLARDI